MDETDHPERDSAVRRVRVTIERLVGAGTAVARSNDTRHDLFPLAVSAPKARHYEGGL